jgi:N-acetyl-anhydromuramoyl-L-alanine amidase
LYKWLLFFAGIVIFYLWFKGKKQAKGVIRNPFSAKSSKPKTLSEPEAMVLCQHCKVHLPKSDALRFEDRFYCSREHFNALDDQGWLGNAAWRISPNQDNRPEQITPDLLVMHHISLPPGEFRNRDSSAYIVDFFQNSA